MRFCTLIAQSQSLIWGLTEPLSRPGQRRTGEEADLPQRHQRHQRPCLLRFQESVGDPSSSLSCTRCHNQTASYPTGAIAPGGSHRKPWLGAKNIMVVTDCGRTAEALALPAMESRRDLRLINYFGRARALAAQSLIPL